MCTVENEAIDVRERGELRLRPRVGAFGIGDARATHCQPQVAACALRLRGVGVARCPPACSSAIHLSFGVLKATIPSVRRTGAR